MNGGKGSSHYRECLNPQLQAQDGEHSRKLSDSTDEPAKAHQDQTIHYLLLIIISWISPYHVSSSEKPPPELSESLLLP